eukprot:9472163-Pyramimonas_sp.AAC.1
MCNWWPLFFKRLKAIVYQMRNRAQNLTMRRHAERSGRQGCASALHDIKLVNFAQWRWSTLPRICQALEGIVTSFILYFDARIFGHVQNHESISSLMDVVAASEPRNMWLTQFRFVSWVCSHVGPVLGWIGTCRCHAEEWEQ